MTGEGRPVLVEILDGQLRSGDTTELDLVRTMNSAIAASPPDTETSARTMVLIYMSGALRRLIARRYRAALLSGRLIRAWQLHEALWDVTEYSMGLTTSRTRDPDADFLRVQLLQLSLANRNADPAGEMARAARAMVRVASAGTSPVE